MTRVTLTSKQDAGTSEIKIESLVKEYFTYIHRLTLSILDDSHEADDAAQDTFIAAHHAVEGFRAEANPKTWLTSIAVNACRSRIRKRKVRQTLSTALVALHLLKNQPPSPEQAAIQSEIDQSIWLAVDALDEKHRTPVILRYVHELNVPEIAEILHLSQGTIHSRLHYARQKLQAQLGHLNPREEVPDEPSG